MICIFQLCSLVALEIMSFLFIVRWNNVVDTVLNYVVFNGICEIDTIYTKSQNDFEIIKVIENDKKKMEKK
jgi:predicted small integral membrane protein